MISQRLWYTGRLPQLSRPGLEHRGRQNGVGSSTTLSWFQRSMMMMMMMMTLSENGGSFSIFFPNIIGRHVWSNVVARTGHSTPPPHVGPIFKGENTWRAFIRAQTSDNAAHVPKQCSHYLRSWMQKFLQLPTAITQLEIMIKSSQI